MMDCRCDLCEARRLGVHSWEAYWGLDSLETSLFRKYPGWPIYWYEAMAQCVRKIGPWHEMDALERVLSLGLRFERILAQHKEGE